MMPRRMSVRWAAVIFVGWALVLPAGGIADTHAPTMWIDTHAHPFTTPGGEGDCLSESCLGRVQARLRPYHVEKSLLSPMPHGNVDLAVEDRLAAALEHHSQRYDLILGGASLNPRIQHARDIEPSQQLIAQFEERADKIAQLGARAYGEMAALHFAFNDQHVFEEVAPNHTLFKRLAQKAALYDMAIDIHMEAVATDVDVKEEIRNLTDLNPETVHANIPAFEDLLDSTAARIVWIHVGWDNTGHMTVPLLRLLLEDHPNLFLQIEISSHPAPAAPENAVLDQQGLIKPKWAKLLADYPDRFLLGSDVFYANDSTTETHIATLDDFVMQLPPGIRDAIARDNAKRIYNLGS